MSQPPPYPPLNYATPAPPPGGPAQKSVRFRSGLFGWLVFILLAVMLVVLVQNSRKQITEIPLSEFYDRLLAGQVGSLTVETDSVWGDLRTATTLPSAVLPITRFRAPLPTGTTGNWAFTEWLLENGHGARISVSDDSSFLTTIVVPLIPWVLIFGFIWFFVFRNLRKAGTAARPGLPAGPIEVVIVSRETK